VRPGDELPGVPQNRLKVNIDYAATDKWKLGDNLIYTSSEFFFGDASNQNPKLPGYWVAELHSSYQITENVGLFAIIQNLFNNQYATSGVFGDVTKTPPSGSAKPLRPALHHGRRAACRVRRRPGQILTAYRPRPTRREPD